MTDRFDTSPSAQAPAYEAEIVSDLTELFGPERFAQMLAGLDEEIVRRLESAAPSEPGLGGDAHALVSVSGTLGFLPLSQACAELERACLAGADAAPELRRAQDAAVRARQAIASLRDGR